VIFSRRRGAKPQRAGRPAANRSRADRLSARTPDEIRPPRRPEITTPPPEFGPYDITQAPDSKVPRLDLGALQLPAVKDVEIQLQAGPQGRIQQIILAHGPSRLQLGVYAAPRTEGIWDEIRAELRSSLAAKGGKPQEVPGDYGTELRAQLREGGGIVDVRHVGIDGPRWFVHGIYVGAAAIDPDRAGPLREVLRGLVVDRGVEARPVREALPLRLPPEAAAQLASLGGPDGRGNGGARAKSAGEGETSRDDTREA